MSFPGGSVVKNLPVDAGNAGSIPGSGRCPGGGHGNPIQYSCMENSKDRGGWQATIHGVAESRKPLGDLTTTINYSHHAVHYIPAAAATSLQSCRTLCDPIDGSPTRLPCPRDSPGKNTRASLFCKWKLWMFMPFGHLHPFHPSSNPLLWQPPICNMMDLEIITDWSDSDREGEILYDIS